MQLDVAARIAARIRVLRAARGLGAAPAAGGRAGGQWRSCFMLSFLYGVVWFGRWTFWSQLSPSAVDVTHRVFEESLALYAR